LSVEFAALTGWRRENVYALTWQDVDFGRLEVRVPIGMSKNGEAIKTPFAAKSAYTSCFAKRSASAATRRQCSSRATSARRGRVLSGPKGSTSGASNSTRAQTR